MNPKRIALAIETLHDLGAPLIELPLEPKENRLSD